MPTSLMKAEQTEIYREYEDNNHVHENDKEAVIWSPGASYYETTEASDFVIRNKTTL